MSFAYPKIVAIALDYGASLVIKILWALGIDLIITNILNGCM
ncbi:hypothetical protein [Nostoc sp. ChiVER01]|nr:hypothetical protein [Nostoc sp. ChiVER01]MDZ8226955.1 hypothetical protein [Nostoc sp. ChiVER01]